MSQTENSAKEFLLQKFNQSFLLNKKQTAEAIGGVSTATLDRLVRDGTIKAKKVSGQVFFTVDEIAMYMVGE